MLGSRTKNKKSDLQREEKQGTDWSNGPFMNIIRILNTKRFQLSKGVLSLLVFLISSSIFAESSSASDSWFQKISKGIELGISGPEFTVQTVFLLFAGGLLASLLPCVYPLYPITVGIIQARGESAKSKLFHPLVYYSGLSFMYLCFGFLAGLSGGAFNTILRYPATNLALAGIIFLLGLASLGLLHLPIVPPKEVKGGQGWKGTFALGMGAGMLSSPCVGPVVVAILIQVTAGVQSVTLSSLALSAFKMALFGFGLGLPFLILGVFGLSLPKTGKWTRWMQAILAFFVFYFAWLYYKKAMDSWSVSSEFTFGILAAILGIVGTVFFLQSKKSHKTERMKRALLVAGFVCCTAILIRLVGWGGAGLTPKKDVVEEHGNLEWHRLSETAFELAKSEDRLVFADFYADWCSNCKAFEDLTLSDPSLNETLRKAVLLKIRDDDKDFLGYEGDPRFPELKIGLPFFVIFSPEGKVLFKTTNYLNTADMVRTLRGETIHAVGD